MNTARTAKRGWLQAVGLGAALLAFPALTALAQTAPTIDGTLDAAYGAPIATSPLNNLLVDANNSPAINDPADPAAKSFDVTNLYATNTGNALYLFIALPYYSFANAANNYSITFHLGGANDALGIPNTSHDPFGGNIYYNYADGKNPNAILTSNVKSVNNNGYAYLFTTGSNGSYDYSDNGDVFNDSNTAVTATTTVLHTTGAHGSEIAYRAGDGTNGGIEIKLPYAQFTLANGANPSPLTAPQVGDKIYIQYYGYTGGRAAVDLVPFEESGRQQPGPDYTTGVLTQHAVYTIKAAGIPEDVVSAGLVNRNDSTKLAVLFADVLGAGATTASNYTLTDNTANTTLAVTSVTIDAANSSQADLVVPTLTPGHSYTVTVSANVKSVNGVAVSANKNSGTFVAPVHATFTITDNGNLIVPDPTTGALPEITIFFFGPIFEEDTLTPVPGNPHAFTNSFNLAPDHYAYKYRINRTDYDTLNRRDRFIDITPNGPNVFNDVVGGGPVNVTFNLVDYQNVVATSGKDVYISGDFTAGSVDTSMPFPNGPAKLTKVAGTTIPTYTVTLPLTQNVYTYPAGGYKYVLIDPTGAAAVDYDSLNPISRSIVIIGSGTPLAQVQNDTAGFSPIDLSSRALGIAGGLILSNPGDITNKDRNADSRIDITDALKLLRYQ